MTSAFHQSGLALKLFDHKPRLHLLVEDWKAWKSRLLLEDFAGKNKKFNSRCLHGRDKKVEYASGILWRHLNSNLKCTSSSRLEGFPIFGKLIINPDSFYSTYSTLHFHLVTVDKKNLILSLASQVEATKRPYHFKMAR